MDKRFDILDAPEDVRALVGECELTGNRTTFLRNGRPVAILISHDEYLALRETIDIADDAPLRAAARRGRGGSGARGDAAAEDLLDSASVDDRLRFAERVENDLACCSTTTQRRHRAKALETIDEDPIIGAPLFEPLRGYWSYRSEGMRIIYRIVAEARFIVVLSIGLVMAR